MSDNKVPVKLHITAVKKHVSNFDFEEMRDATEEERESVKSYVDSISEPTGVNFFDVIESKEGTNEI